MLRALFESCMRPYSGRAQTNCKADSSECLASRSQRALKYIPVVVREEEYLVTRLITGPDDSEAIIVRLPAPAPDYRDGITQATSGNLTQSQMSQRSDSRSKQNQRKGTDLYSPQPSSIVRTASRYAQSTAASRRRSVSG